MNVINYYYNYFSSLCISLSPNSVDAYFQALRLTPRLQKSYRKLFFTVASQLPVKKIIKPESAIYDDVNMPNHSFPKFFSIEK